MLAYSFETIFVPGSPLTGPPCPWAPWVTPGQCPEWPSCSRASGPADQLHSDTCSGLVPVSVPPADRWVSPDELSRMEHRSSEAKSPGLNTQSNGSQPWLHTRTTCETSKTIPGFRPRYRPVNQNFRRWASGLVFFKNSYNDCMPGVTVLK